LILGSNRFSYYLMILGSNRFSYYLMPFQDANTTSKLLLGPSESFNGTTGIRSTPFVASPAKAPMTRASPPPPPWGRCPCG
jgi:hypothetical protein